MTNCEIMTHAHRLTSDTRRRWPDADYRVTLGAALRIAREQGMLTLRLPPGELRQLREQAAAAGETAAEFIRRRCAMGDYDILGDQLADLVTDVDLDGIGFSEAELDEMVSCIDLPEPCMDIDG